MVDPKLIQQAKNRLRDRSPNSFSAEPSEQELLDEISSIQEENQNSQVIDNEGLDNRIETGMQRRALFGDQISPELKEYAYNIFPSLNEIAPKTDVQTPLALDQQMQQEEPQIQQERQPASIQAEKPQSVIQKEPQPETQEIAPQITPQIPQQEKVSDIEKMLQEARKKEDTAEYFKDLAKLRDAAMGVGSGRVITGDYSTYEEMKKRAKRPMEEMLLKQELEDRKAKNDPNSSVSKLMRKTLQDTGVSMEGFDNVSYAQLEKIYPSLANTISAKIAADARKEEARLNRLVKAEAAASKEQLQDFNKYQKVAVGIDRLKSNMEKSDTYKSYSNAKDALTALDEALSSTDPNIKIQKAAAFMKFAKSAQGDNSVVRSEDMKVLAGSLGYNNPREMLAKFAAKAEGSQFTPGELQAMKKVVSTIIDVKKKQLNTDYLQPMQKRAEVNKYDLSESMSPEFIRDIQGEETSSIETESSYTPKQEAGIKAYMESKKISREEAIKRLKNGGRL